MGKDYSTYSSDLPPAEQVLQIMRQSNIVGPVVQNFVILMLSLSPQFVDDICISSSKANTLLFFVEKKCENPLQCKGFSHFFSTKNNSVFVQLPFEILTNH